MPRQPSLFHCCRKPHLAINHCICGPCMIGRQCNSLAGEQDSMSVLHCCCSLFGPMYTCCVCCIRRKTSQKYDLDESCCKSLCAACFCPCCSLTQTWKAMRRWGDRAGLVLAPPKISGMPQGAERAHAVQERKVRRADRVIRNTLRRANDGSSSESDSSGSDAGQSDLSRDVALPAFARPQPSEPTA